MTVDEMLTRIRQTGITYSDISKCTGIPLSTLQKIFSKATVKPRRTTMQILSDFFTPSGYSCAAEAPAEYKTDGTGALQALSIWERTDNTLEDYLALPDDIRVELIDGVFYNMASPSILHQRIASLIAFALETYVDANDGPCIPFIAPSDVQLDCDDKTIVEPDVFVVCDRDKITLPRTVGAPDLVIEVLSGSSWYHDTVRKLKKYKNAGVREYWIVLPDEKRVWVYFFEESDIYTEYTFDDTVPVRIWDGKCKVDFKKIFDKISFLYTKRSMDSQ